MLRLITFPHPIYLPKTMLPRIGNTFTQQTSFINCLIYVRFSPLIEQICHHFSSKSEEPRFYDTDVELRSRISKSSATNLAQIEEYIGHVHNFQIFGMFDKGARAAIKRASFTLTLPKQANPTTIYIDNASCIKIAQSKKQWLLDFTT